MMYFALLFLLRISTKQNGRRIRCLLTANLLTEHAHIDLYCCCQEKLEMIPTCYKNHNGVGFC